MAGWGGSGVSPGVGVGVVLQSGDLASSLRSSGHMSSLSEVSDPATEILNLAWPLVKSYHTIQIIPFSIGRGSQLVLLLCFHSSVLEPDLYLSLRQSKVMSNLYSTPSSQVSVEMKFLEL